jgi:hypothetical protein
MPRRGGDVAAALCSADADLGLDAAFDWDWDVGSFLSTAQAPDARTAPRLIGQHMRVNDTSCRGSPWNHLPLTAES